MSNLTRRLAALFVSAAVVFSVGSARALEYKVVKGQDGLVVSISDLPTGEVNSFVVGYGDKNYGENLADWPNYVLLGAPMDGGTLTMPYPSGWGSSVTDLAVFVLNGEDAALPIPDGYVKSGLVAQWDALDGVVMNEDGTAPVSWVDRTHGYTFPLAGCSLTADGTIALPNGTSETLAGDDAAAVSAALLDSGINTLEWTLTYKSGNYIFYGTAASHIIFCAYQGNFILSYDRDLGLAISSTPRSTYAVTYDHSGMTGPKFITDRYCNGEVATGSASGWSPGGDKMMLGSNASVEHCAFRIYNRRLTPTEVAVNAKVDAMRYRGAEFDPAVFKRGVCVAKLSATEGLYHHLLVPSMVRCTVAGEGWYKDGSSVTLTAMPAEGSAFVRWEPSVPEGCSATDSTLVFDIHSTIVLRAYSGHLFTLDAINRDADEKPVSAVLSFDNADATNTLFVAYGATDAGLTLAGWDHVETVGVVSPEITSRTVPFPEGWGDDDGPKKLRYFVCTGVGTESIVTKNLLAHWDAIDNQATGTHDETATDTWVDLVAGREVALTGASVGDDVIDLTASGSYGFLGDEDTLATFAHGTARTIEFRARVPSNSGDSALLAAPSASGVGICLWGGGFTWPYTSYGVPGKTGAPLVRALQNMKTIALGYSGNSCNALYLDGAEPVDYKNDSYNFITKPTAGTYFGSGDAGNQKMSCKFQVVRVYDGAPDANTVFNNHLADHARFVDGAVLGGVEAYSDALEPNSDIHGTFNIAASVPRGTVTGAGEYEAGSEVTLSVAMEEGCTFVCWLGDLPEGCDAHSPTLTFTAAAHVNLTGFIQMPWEVVADANGTVTKVTNSVWTIAASATGQNMKLLSPSSVSEQGQREELDKALDFTTFEAVTGYRIVELGDGVFSGKTRLASVRLSNADLVKIGTYVFQNVNASFPSDGDFPNLEYLGGGANVRVGSFVAPKLAYYGSGGVNHGIVTNFEPRTITWALDTQYLIGSFKFLRGSFVIDSPSTKIPSCFMYDSWGLESVTINSPVTDILSWAFGNCSSALKIYWNVPPPKIVATNPETLGKTVGADGELHKPTPQLIVNKMKTVEGFKSGVTGLTFTPKEELDPKYLTKAYGYNSRCVGILSCGTERIWLVRPGVGTVFRVK